MNDKINKLLSFRFENFINAYAGYHPNLNLDRKFGKLERRTFIFGVLPANTTRGPSQSIVFQVFAEKQENMKNVILKLHFADGVRVVGNSHNDDDV